MLKRASPSRYEDLTVVARGSFGVVYSALDSHTQLKVAIKRNTHVEHHHHEVSIMSHLRGHDHIVELLDQDAQEFVMPFIRSTLRMLMNTKDGPSRTWSRGQVKGYLQQLFRGVAHCHAHGIVHCDLKPDNILITRTHVLKVADYGTAQFWSPDAGKDIPIATRWYRPLEIFFGKDDYGYELDSWSLGCIMGELMQNSVLMAAESDADQPRIIQSLCGSPAASWPPIVHLPDYEPCKHNEPRNLRKRLQKENAAINRRHFFSDDALELLNQLLDYDPMARIAVKDALNAHYFNPSPEEDLPTPMSSQDMI